MALDAADDLVAGRVHLPARPRRVEAEKRDQPAFRTVAAMAFAVGFVPAHVAGELGLRDRTPAEPEMDMMVEQRFAVHARLPRYSPFITKALSLLPSGSRK